MPRIEGPEFDPLLGRGVSTDDLAELSRRRKAQAMSDMSVLGAIEHRIDSRVQCEWCRSKVFRYGSTPGGERHYCRTCVSSIMALVRGTSSKCGDMLATYTCTLQAGHPGKHRDDNHAGFRRAWNQLTERA